MDESRVENEVEVRVRVRIRCYEVAEGKRAERVPPCNRINIPHQGKVVG